ncbi:MAG: hypothetical protein RIR26_966 [Pseudomonadota bacterium]|jgi:subtilisin family serine protease
MKTAFNTLLLMALFSLPACLKKNSVFLSQNESPLPDVVMPEKSAQMLGIDETIMEDALSGSHLEAALHSDSNRPEIVELNLLLKENWPAALPLKTTDGAVRRLTDIKDIRDVVALGDIPVQKIKLPKPTLKSLKKIFRDQGKSAEGFELLRIEVAAKNTAALIDIINRIHKLSSVLVAEPNHKVVRGADAQDPMINALWGLRAIKAPQAWNQFTGRGSQVIAVIDSGIDIQHPDLQENLWTNSNEVAGNGLDDDANGFIDDVNGWDFGDDDNGPDDISGHGTHCAGIIGARGNNDTGIVGVNWNARIMPVKIFSDATGDATFNDAYDGILYAIANGAKVLSNSWGGTSASAVLATAMNIANNNQRLVVAAAGNDSSPAALYPAYYTTQYPNIISVGSSDPDGRLSAFSNFGAGVDIAAPGKNIMSTLPKKSYGELSGTSMATPFVSGAAILLWNAYPEKSMGEIKAALLNGSDYDPQFEGKVAGARALNIENALNTLQGIGLPRQQPPPSLTRGLTYKYFEGKWNKIPQGLTEPALKSGASETLTLSVANRQNNYALVFDGVIRIDSAGTYEFALTSDDGSRLTINDTTVINNDGIHTKKSKSGSIKLPVGYQKFRVEYFQAGSGRTLQLEMRSPAGKSKNINESGQLFYFL